MDIKDINLIYGGIEALSPKKTINKQYVSEAIVNNVLGIIKSNKNISRAELIKVTSLSCSAIDNAILKLKENDKIIIFTEDNGHNGRHRFVAKEPSEFKKTQASRVPKQKTLDAVELAVTDNPNSNRAALIKATGFNGHTVSKAIDFLISKNIVLAKEIGRRGGYPTHNYIIKD